MEFRTLGSLDVIDRGEPLFSGTPRDRTVLAILMARANELVGVDLLVDELWPQGPPPKARPLVHGYVSRIRRALRRSPAGHAAAARLVTRKPGYLLRVEDCELDLHRFEKLTAQARTALRAGQSGQSWALLGQVRRLWRGTPFADVPLTPVLAATATRIVELRLVTLEGLYAAALAGGHDADLVAELTELSAEHPLREHLVAQLMLALHRSGRTADALDTYRRITRRLADELGIGPGARLQRIQLDILRGDPGAAPAKAEIIAPVPQQLPAASAVFTGRIRELADLDRAGALPAVPITAIDGMAGVGKTALAVQAAHRLAPRYPDGQIFLDLHGFTEGLHPVDPADALDRVLRVLGVPDDLIPAHLDDRSALLRTTLAGRRVLLVLDNAADADQVRPLLPGTPGCMVLITSRRRLADLDDAVPVSLDVLPSADAFALFTRALGADRQGVLRADLVTEVVALCGRLPLAIRIAAARLRAHPAWTLAHLVQRLRDHQSRLAELATGQRSVTTALDLSYRHLSRDQQRLYRLLGLHFGPETDRSAAAALADTTPAQAGRLLDDLSQAHLVREPVPGRYRLHDLVRVHAVQTCREHESRRSSDGALSRLLDHYARTVSVATDLLYPQEGPHRPHVTVPDRFPTGLASQADAAAWLDTELPNLLAAAALAAGSGRPAHTIHMSVTMFHHLRVRGRLRNAETLHAQAVQAAERTGDRIGLLRALVGLGDVHNLTGRAETAVAYFERAIDIAGDTDDPAGELAALRGLAHILCAKGRYVPATGCYERALALAHDIGDRVGELHTLIGLALIRCQSGRHDHATESLGRALAIARDISDRIGELRALCGLGHVDRVRGRYASSVGNYWKALTIAREIGDRLGELRALCGLGHVYRMQGRSDCALDHYGKALADARIIGNHGYMFEALYGLGQAHLAGGRPDQALMLHRHAIELAHVESPSKARAHRGLAEAHHALGQHDQAHDHWRRALTVLNGLGLTDDGEIGIEHIRARLG